MPSSIKEIPSSDDVLKLETEDIRILTEFVEKSGMFQQTEKGTLQVKLFKYFLEKPNINVYKTQKELLSFYEKVACKQRRDKEIEEKVRALHYRR